VVCTWVFFQPSLFPVIILVFCAHPFFDMPEPSQSMSLDLVLYILHRELFSDVCISDSVCLGLSHLSFNFISVAYNLLSCPLVCVHYSAPYNTVFLKYSLCILWFYTLCLCLCSIICCILSGRIMRPFLFFRLFHSISRCFFLYHASQIGKSPKAQPHVLTMGVGQHSSRELLGRVIYGGDMSPVPTR
jgi:hypothetical protein